MKKWKIAILIIIVIVVVGGIAGVIAKNKIENSLNQLEAAAIPEIDLTKIEDGTYIGSYKVFPVSAKVEVIVKDHKMIEIDLIEHENGQGAPAEVIPDQVVEAQSLDVDTVSGATFSSKVILFAIENALNHTQSFN